MTEDEYHAEIQQLRNELAELRRGKMRVAEAEPVKRVTNTEVLRALLERHVRTTLAERSTVRLTRNSKGDTQIEVYVQTGEAEDVATVEEAAAKARSVYETLRAFYPLHNGGAE